MTEPPLKVSPEGVEPEPHKVGHRWIDLILAGSAILISVVSLGIAVKHGAIMQKLVAANSWPVLFFETGNQDDDTGERRITLKVRNDGAGPALLKHIEVRYRDQTLRGAADLLDACCGGAPKSRTDAERVALGSQRIGQSVIPAGASTTFINLPLTEGNRAEWERLDRERFRLKFDACYCSVLGECWRSDLTGIEPRKVKSCPASGGYRE
jgi:hypothetical protein